MSSLGVCYNGRRRVIKVSPTTVLQVVLEEACAHYSLNSQHCRLKKGRNFVDLSLPFRFSNLPSNSSVDIIEDEGAATSTSASGATACGTAAAADKPAATCRIALSVEGLGSMPTTVFPVTYSLQDVVAHFAQEGKIPAAYVNNMAGASGASPAFPADTGESVEVIYLQSRFRGSQLVGTTLGGLGLARQAARLQLRLPAALQQAEDNGGAPLPMSVAHAAAGAVSKDGGKSISSMEVGVDAGAKGGPAQTVFSPPLAAGAAGSLTSASPTPTDGSAELCALLDENFDAVSRPALVTLSKYIFNVWASPLEPKFRVIFTDNRAFGERVAPCAAALRFLAAVGFVQDSVNGRQALRLPLGTTASSSDEEGEAALLKPTVTALEAALHECNVPFDERPRPADRVQMLAARQQQQIQQPIFDPYRSMVRRVAGVNPDGIVSMTGTMTSGRAGSSTDSRLATLTARREELEGAPSNAAAEPTYVVVPCADADIAAFQKMNGEFSAADDKFSEEERGDGNLLAAAMAATLRNKSEDAPLTTAAIRAVRKAESELVYSRTLVRVRFPDRTELQRCLHPRNTMRDVYAWVRDCFLGPQLAQLVELYITPPRQVLKDDDTTLAELRLVPAVLLNVKWLGSTPPTSAGTYIKPALLASASPTNVVGIPAGVPLVPRTNISRDAGIQQRNGATLSSPPSSSAEAPAKKAKSGKPSWLKI